MYIIYLTCKRKGPQVTTSPAKAISPEIKISKLTQNKRLKGIPVLWLLLLSLAAFAGILLASNVGPASSSSYLVLGNIVFMALILKGAEKSGRGMKCLSG